MTGGGGRCPRQDSSPQGSGLNSLEELGPCLKETGSLVVGCRQSLGPSPLCVLASAQENLLVAHAGTWTNCCGWLWGFRQPRSPYWSRRGVCSPHPALWVSVPLAELAALQANASALRAWLRPTPGTSLFFASPCRLQVLERGCRSGPWEEGSGPPCHTCSLAGVVSAEGPAGCRLPGHCPHPQGWEWSAPSLPSAAPRDYPDGSDTRLVSSPFPNLTPSKRERKGQERGGGRQREETGRPSWGEGSPSGRQRDPPTPPGGFRPAACSNKLETPVT